MKLNLNSCTRFLTTACKRIKYTSVKHSPEILLITGTVGIITSTVMACKATLKVEEVLDEAQETINVIHEVAADETKKDKYSEEDSKKDITITYAKTGYKLAKMYAPSVITGGLSIACLFTSHHILCRRNLAIASAYAGLKEEYKKYRSRIVDEFGSQKDRELKYGIKAKEIVKKALDEKGNEIEVKEVVKELNPNDISIYARFFEEYAYRDENDNPVKNMYWVDDPEYRLTFLKKQQSYANDRLRTEKYLYLNDVYEMIGLPKTREGQKVGWIYDEKNPVGDNYVDFGLYKDHLSYSDFANGMEEAILLDFNVDGEILDLMPTFGVFGIGCGNKHRDEFDLKAHA